MVLTEGGTEIPFRKNEWRSPDFPDRGRLWSEPEPNLKLDPSDPWWHEDRDLARTVFWPGRSDGVRPAGLINGINLSDKAPDGKIVEFNFKNAATNDLAPTVPEKASFHHDFWVRQQDTDG